MKDIYYIINGPNLNMLGIREPEHYGRLSYTALCTLISSRAEALGVKTVLFQSNHEGDLVDKIQEAYFEGASGIVINPGAYTHTSIAILDALKAVKLRYAEVHISDVDSREEFRKISYIREGAAITVSGHGVEGYLEALSHLVKIKNSTEGQHTQNE